MKECVAHNKMSNCPEPLNIEFYSYYKLETDISGFSFPSSTVSNLPKPFSSAWRVTFLVHWSKSTYGKYKSYHTHVQLNIALISNCPVGWQKRWTVEVCFSFNGLFSHNYNWKNSTQNIMHFVCTRNNWRNEQ